MKRLHLKLIGAFSLSGPDGSEIPITSDKSIALLALLATAPDGSRSRKFLSELLWSGKVVGDPGENLRQELRNLARTLEQHRAGHILHWYRRQKIALDLSVVTIDIDELGRGNSPAAYRDLQFLEGLDCRNSNRLEQWLQRKRTWLRDMFELDSAASSGERVEASAASHSTREAEPRALAPKPAVIVLPFTNIGRNAEPVIDGEDVGFSIGARLSRLPQLKILSSREAAAVMKRDNSPLETARLLGAQYLLSGSVRSLSTGCKATAELTDCTSGEQFWSQTFTAHFDDSEEIEDVIALSVAPQIWSEVDQAERDLRLRTSDLAQTAYDKYWRASALYRRWDRTGVNEAVSLTESLLETNPSCPFSLGLSSFCNALAYRFGWTDDADESRKKVLERTELTYRHGPRNAEALGYAAGALLVLDEKADFADQLVEHAIDLDPEQQPPYFWGGWIDLRCGRTDRARERFKLSLELNPASGVKAYAMTGIGLSHLLQGDFKAAIAHLLPSAEVAPEFILTHAGLLIAGRALGDEEVIRNAALMIEELGGVAAVSSLLGKERQGLIEAVLPSMQDG